MNPLTDLLVRHDVDDTSALLDAAKGLTDEEYRRDLLSGASVTSWEGPEPSIAAVLEHHVWTKEVWVAAIEGEDIPDRAGDDVATLVRRHEAVGARWIAVVRDIEQPLWSALARHGQWPSLHEALRLQGHRPARTVRFPLRTLTDAEAADVAAALRAHGLLG